MKRKSTPAQRRKASQTLNSLIRRANAAPHGKKHERRMELQEWVHAGLVAKFGRVGE